MHDHLAATTSREEFRQLAAEHRVVPVTRKVLADSETPLSAYRKLAANRPGVVPMHFQIPLAKLNAGSYTAQVNVVDDLGGKFAFPRSTLVVLP